MKNRLIPLSDYVLEENQTTFTEYTNNHEKVIMYARFLKQNLSEPYYIDGVKCHPLNRFVPCDLEGNVLEEKTKNWLYEKGISKTEFTVRDNLYKQYTEAKNRVLFEGWAKFTIIDTFIYYLEYKQSFHDKTIDIEHLIKYNCNLTLTPTGAKMCGKEFEK